MAETGYSVVVPVIWTLLIVPLAIVTETLTPPRRLVPWPVYVPSA
jgi:hypothetical protein